jgi:hypothetical protein
VPFVLKNNFFLVATMLPSKLKRRSQFSWNFFAKKYFTTFKQWNSKMSIFLDNHDAAEETE